MEQCRMSFRYLVCTAKASERPKGKIVFQKCASHTVSFWGSQTTKKHSRKSCKLRDANGAEGLEAAIGPGSNPNRAYGECGICTFYQLSSPLCGIWRPGHQCEPRSQHKLRTCAISAKVNQLYKKAGLASWQVVKDRLRIFVILGSSPAACNNSFCHALN